MFRLAHLCTTCSFGGLELNVLRLMERMNTRGHENLIFAQPHAAIAREASGRGLHVEPVTSRRKYFDRVASRLMAALIEKEEVDALLVHPAGDINLGAMTKRTAQDRCRLLHLQHMEIGVSKRDPFHSWSFRRLDAWIVPIPSLRRNVLRRTRVDREIVHVIPLGIDIGRFDASRMTRGEARELLALPSEAYFAGVVGRLDVGKGQEHLVAALRFLCREMPDLHLLFVGDETKGEAQKYGEKLRRMAAEAGLEARVHLRPFQREVAAVYAAMDLFCLTSIAETYGMVTLEAMAMNIPVIATDSAGTPDIVRHESNGLLVPPRDPRALADAIKRIRENAEFARNLTATARTDVETSYTHTRQCEMTEELLASLLEGGK